MNRRTKIILLSILGILFTFFAWAWFAPCGLGGCAPVTELERFKAEGAALFDAKDRPFSRLAMANRRLAVMDSVPAYLPEAFVAIEDRRFYEHAGVDWRRAGGAMLANFRRRGVAEGGSTITMQLARNLFPERLPYQERSLRRKLMEIRVARQIERAFPKRKILELYLNHIYLGEGAYGVESASQEYFGKSARQLTLSEAAIIAGMGQSPSRRNPRADRVGALRRRDEVLRAMALTGRITQEQAAQAAAQPLRLARPRARGQRAAWFVDRVRQELEESVGDRLYTDGLRVYTSYDPEVQTALESELAKQADAIEAGAFGRFTHPTYPEARGKGDESGSTYLQGAAVVMDARSGEVLGLVGGRDYEDSKFDRVFSAQRQPGSAFKPFIYLAALGQGIPPTERFQDAPVELDLGGGRIWRPRNYTGTYDGPITMRDALTRSKNTVAVRLSQQVGIGAVAEQARALGITTPIPLVPATALGAAEVRPIELVTAYAAFANGGVRVTPHLVRRVEDRHGEVIWEAPSGSGERVVDGAAAFVLTSMLRDVVDRGTGTPVRAAGFRGVAAGKTGTTNGATDAWFVGYTPELVGSIWFGFDQPRPIMTGASGGTLAAPVWGRVMSRVYAHRRQPLAWSAPAGVIEEQVSRVTGQASDPQCPAQGPTYTEYFVGTRPPRAMCVTWDSLYSPYPPVDTVWRDEEWNPEPYQPDTVGMGRRLPPDTTHFEQNPERNQPPPTVWEVTPAPAPQAPAPVRRRGSRSMQGEPGSVNPPPPAAPPVLGTPRDSLPGGG